MIACWIILSNPIWPRQSVGQLGALDMACSKPGIVIFVGWLMNCLWREKILMNPRFTPESLYRRLIAQWLVHWPDGKELVLVFDRTEVADRFNVLMLAVGFRGRAIPLTRDILSHKGACCFAEQKKLLDRIEPYMPTQTCIALMEDSEFRSARHFRYAS